MGHASGTITFDTYGRGVLVDNLAVRLRELFMADMKTIQMAKI
jgi:hypothetical protein